MEPNAVILTLGATSNVFAEPFTMKMDVDYRFRSIPFHIIHRVFPLIPFFSADLSALFRKS